MYVTEFDPRKGVNSYVPLPEGKLGTTPLYLVWCENCGTPQCVCYTRPTQLATLNGQFDGGRIIYGKLASTAWEINRPGDPVSLIEWAYLFYGVLAADMRTQGRYRRGITQPLLKDMADTLARAVVMSCLGEARYHANCVLHNLFEMVSINLPDKSPDEVHDLLMETNLGSWMRDIGLPTYTATHDSVIARDTAVRALKPPATFEKVKHYARLAKTIHYYHTKGYGSESGVGGALWYQGAKTAWAYLTGQVDAALFIDQVFDMMHNGGNLVNKIIDCTDGEELFMFLEWRKEATLEEMLARCPDTVKDLYDIPYRKDDPSTWMPREIMLRNWLNMTADWMPDRQSMLIMSRYNTLYEYFTEDHGPGGTHPYVTRAQAGEILRWWETAKARKIPAVKSLPLKKMSVISDQYDGAVKTTVPGAHLNAQWWSSAAHVWPANWEYRRPNVAAQMYCTEIPARFAWSFNPYARGGMWSLPNYEDVNTKKNSLRRTITEQVQGSGRWKYLPVYPSLATPEMLEQWRDDFAILGVKVVPKVQCAMCADAYNEEHGVVEVYTAEVHRRMTPLEAIWRDAVREARKAGEITATEYAKLKMPIADLYQMALEGTNLPAQLCFAGTNFCTCRLHIKTCCREYYYSGWHALTCPPTESDRLYQELLLFHGKHHRFTPTKTWSSAALAAKREEKGYEDEDEDDEECDLGYGGCDWDEYGDECCCHYSHHGLGCVTGCECDECTGTEDEDKDESVPPKSEGFATLGSMLGKIEAEVDKLETSQPWYNLTAGKTFQHNPEPLFSKSALIFIDEAQINVPNPGETSFFGNGGSITTHPDFVDNGEPAEVEGEDQ